MKKFRIYLLLILPILLSCQSNRAPEPTSINLAHLAHLTQTVTLGQRQCDLVHIYAEYPDYEWVDANQEGITCVDDVARAAVVYLRYYEISGDKALLENARRLLNFVRFMQTGDGEFYNFVDESLKINRTGITSRKSFNFWAARGYWALGLASRVFQKADPVYAESLQQAFLKCRIPLKKILKNYSKFDVIEQREYPIWLMNQSGADATSEFLLGLVEYLKIDPRPELLDAAQKLAEGILKMQQPAGAPCAGAFLSWRQRWHAWGNAQSMALIELSQLLESPKLLSAVQREADSFFAKLIVEGLRSECRFGAKFETREFPPEMRKFPQIAYDIRGIAVGLLKLASATNDSKYEKMAGLAASWLMGNNPAQTQMYDAETGRCFDGINDSTSVNLNAGAESTIEALLTLVELSEYPTALKFMDFRNLRRGQTQKSGQFYRVFRHSTGEKIAVILKPEASGFEILTGATGDSLL